MYIYTYIIIIYVYVFLVFRQAPGPRPGIATFAAFSAVRSLEGGRVAMTEILLPRIARQGTDVLISIRG